MTFDAAKIKELLTEASAQELASRARAVADSVFGKEIYIRGLIEISNICRNNCLYCGIRAANSSLPRYRLSRDQILECCRKGYALGLHTFVLQGGEDLSWRGKALESLVREIKAEFGDCALTLSLGEMSREEYAALRNAGADRYLLRHETFNPEHYSRLHPESMSRSRRLECLKDLKDLGFQTGTGIMVGSPFQTIDNIVEDLLYIESLQPQMIGIGPFIHHPDTPFADFPDGSVDLTLRLISILRLISPRALIPATTALSTLDPRGRLKGILAGANVVMPNLTPESHREDYSLYAAKASSGAESAEGLSLLEADLQSIGYKISRARGDWE